MEIVVATTDNFVIGANGKMPWHLPADLAHFKRLTSGHTIVMGRKTWESIGKALPNRLNIVLTRQDDFKVEGAIVINTLDEIAHLETRGRIFIIGGGEIYKQSLAKAKWIHITRIRTLIEGDTTFPKFDEQKWRCVERTEYCADEKNCFDLCFESWSRVL